MFDIKMKRKLSVTAIFTYSFLTIILVQIFLILFNFKMLKIDDKLKRMVYDNVLIKSEETSQKLENSIINSWSNEIFMGEVISYAKQVYSTKGKLDAKIIEPMINMMNSMMASNAFLIVDDSTYDTDNIVDLYDNDTTMRGRKNADITMLTGSESLKKETNLVLEPRWTPRYTKYSVYKDIYKKFYEYARNTALGENLHGDTPGFWYFIQCSDVDKYMNIFYIKPLVDDKGTFFGVIAVRVATDRVEDILNYKNIAKSGNGSYILTKLRDDGSYDIVNLYGPHIKSILGDKKVLTVNRKKNPYFESSRDSIQSEYIYNLNIDKNILMLRDEVRLYTDENSDGRLFLFTSVKSNYISNVFNNFFMYLLEAIFISIVIGIVAVYILSLLLILPIKRLSRNIECMIYDDNISKIDKINIIELDNLVDVIEVLSNKLVENSKRFQVIMDQTSIPIVAIEKNDKDYLVNKLGMISNILQGFKDNEMMNEIWSAEEYEKFNEKLFKNTSLVDSVYDIEKDKQYDIYQKRWNDKDYYLKITTKRVENEGETSTGNVDLSLSITSKTLQVIEDCTKEVTEKIKIKNQRDFDVLTGLLNRFSFKKMVEDFVEQDNMKIRKAAMIMWDLDNLKYVNDTYGHDMGDKYIQEAAKIINIIKKKKPDNLSYIARVSGDEFFALVEYSDSKDEIRALVEEVRFEMSMSKLQVNDEIHLKVRGTAGICWYPEDASTYDKLNKFADFAMYIGKSTNKGTISEFDKNLYEKNYILLSGKEDIIKFIEDRQVRYAFQPIVSAKDGSVFAYESLMRSTSDAIKSVEDVLRLSKAQSKFTEIEIMTFEEVLKTMSENIMALRGKKVFINSISSTILPAININILYSKYADLLTNIVIELTESEDFSKEYLEKKKKMKSDFGCMIAIDDFGTGYATDSWLLDVSPDFLKIDMHLIRDIDKDAERRVLVKNILAYSKEKNIKTIAEGVETYSEMEALIDMGVDYIQGYYLGKPQFDIVDIGEDKKREIQVLYSLKNI